MSQNLCSRCLTFNKRSSKRCINCQHTLRSSGWGKLFSPPATNASPFSIDAPHAVDNSFLVRTHETPIPHFRYRALLLMVLALGGLAAYFRVRGPQNTGEGATISPLSRIVSLSNARIREVPRSSLSDEERLINTWNVLQDFTPEVGLSGQFPKRFMSLGQTFLSEPSPGLQHELEQIYEKWKLARSSSHWDEYFELYDSNAKIVGVEGEEATLQKLEMKLKSRPERYFHISNRPDPLSHTSTSTWGVDSALNPTQIELFVTENYSLWGQTKEQKQALRERGIPTAVFGGRHLIWTKKNNGWKITRDSFTPLNSLFYRIPRYNPHKTQSN